MTITARRELTLERHSELDAIEQALARRGAGGGSLLLVHGVAGVGKTRLLRDAAELAGDGLVLSACGAEFESQFPFAVVRQLFERLPGEPPAQQRRALGDGPVGLADRLLDRATTTDARPSAVAQPGAAFDVIHGIYRLVVELAAAEPLLLLVDNAHWADESSLRALSYLARRLDGLAVSMIVAFRRGEDAADGGLRELVAEPAAKRLAPKPLTPAASGKHVGAITRTTIDDRRVAAACHAATGGNPFLLSQLAQALADAGVAPSVAAIETIKTLPPERLVQAVMLRLGPLSSAAVLTLRALAVLGDGAELRDLVDLAGLGRERAVATLAALTRAGIITDGPRVGFVQRLVRAAVYAELSAAERADWHERAFEQLRDVADVEQLAGHLMFAAPCSDAVRVRMLCASARSASARGAHEVSARLLTRALNEPPPHEERPAVLLECGLAELQAGDCAAAARHLRAALTTMRDPDLAVKAAVGLARALVVDEGIAAAVAALDGAAAGLDGDRALRLEVERTTFALYDSQLARAAQERTRDYAHLPGKTPAQRIALANASLALAFNPAATAHEAVKLARRALGDGLLVAEQGCEAPSAGQALYPLMLAGDFETVERELAHLQADARRRGSAFAELNRLACCMMNFERGQLAAAIAEGEAGWRIAFEIHRSPIVRRWGAAIVRFLAEAQIERGALDEASALLTQASRALDLDAPEGGLCRHARGLLAFAAGDAQAALREFCAFGAANAANGYEERNSRWRLGAALAADALGDRDRSRALAAEELALARVWGAPGGIGAAQRVHALVGDPDESVAGLAESVATLAATQHRLLHAHALVDLGVAHRRRGNRVLARDALARGMDLATRCQATPLAERAHHELVVLGARPRRRRISGIDALTSSERRIAALASHGQTNREIAQHLYVAPKTVENHLAVVYRKLGISGRKHLPSALAP
jgi:DNA-binding CsgD family transcriptional regulator